MMKKICMLLMIFYTFQTTAQIPDNDELLFQLKGKTNFSEVWNTINQYYITRDYTNNPKLYSEFKKWNRWAWWESKHLDASGKMINSNKKIFEETNSITQKLTYNRLGNLASNGGTWNLIGPQNLSSGIARVDRLAFHPTNASIIYAGTPASGLWKTVDGGNSWQPLNGFLPSLGVSGIVVDAVNPNILYVLTGDGDSFANGGFVYTRQSIGILKSTDAGNTWSKLSGIIPSGSTTAFYGYKLIQMPDFNNVLFAATSRGLYRSSDFGQNWQACTGVSTFQNVFDVELKPNNSATVYASVRDAVYVSNDYGQSFAVIQYFGITSSNTRSALAVTPAVPNNVYINFGSASQSLLYVSAASGSTFTLLSSAHPATSSYMSAFTIHPLNANRLILGALNVIYSTDAGANFNAAVNIHADIHDLAYNNNFLYAACDGGVYRSNDNGASWVYLSNGIAATQYYHMSATEQNDNAIIAGSQDNGYMRRSNTGIFSLSDGGDGFSGKFLNNSTDTYIYSINSGVFKRTISSNSFSQLLVGGTSVNDMNFFFPSIEIHPTDNNIIYAGFTDSLRRSTNGGVNWTAFAGSGSAGFGFSGGLAVSPNNPDRLYLANGNQLRISNNKGTTQTVISGNPGWAGVTGNITDVTSRPNNADEVWVTFSGFIGTKVLYSSNAGATWVNFTGSLPDLPVYCIKYTSAGDVYIGNDFGVYAMTFAMSDWAPFYNGLPNIPVTDLFVNETANTIKASTFGRGIWQSDLYADCAPFLALGSNVQGRYFYQTAGILQSAQQMDSSYGNELRYRSPVRVRLTNGFKASGGSYLHAVIGPCGQGVFNRNSPAIVKTKTEQLSQVR